MNAKEKAKELVQKYENAIYEKFTYTGDCVEAMSLARECALINVEEILKSHYIALTGVKPSIYNAWQEVKKEIELL